MGKEHYLEKLENISGQIRVLHVDSDIEYLDASEKELESSRESMNIIKTTSMEEALDIVNSEDVDFILSGFQIENGNGLQLLDKIRGQRENVPFILLTSEDKREIIAEALSKGATDCFPKEFDNGYEILTKRIENTVLKSKIRKEKEINEKELNKYKRLVETSSESMLVISPDLEIVKANQAIENITGLRPEEIEGEKISIFREKNVIRGQEFERIHEELKELAEDEDKDSATLEIEMSAKAPAKYVELNFAKFYDGDSNLAGLTSIGHDVTDIETERRSKQRRLSEFSSLVSHDLRNPLNLAQGYLDLARETEDEEDYQVIEKAHNRMERIIDELLIVTSQDEEISKENFNLKDTFEEAYYFAGEQSSSYKVEENIEIYGDRTSAISMFENLISNSIHHNEESIEIRVGPTEDGFYYEDTGTGIPEDKRDKVFEYGYSSSDEGRGIGLAIVKRIVEANDWDFKLGESEEGGMRLEFKTSNAE